MMMQDEFSYELKIPKERIAVLIGTNGEVKKEIEKRTSTTISIDSAEGIVTIVAHDGLFVYNAKEICQAIARGFNPDVAMLLMKIDHILEVINLGKISSSKKDEMRVKGRIIGKDGKSRKIIEELTETNIVIFGKTVSIIGEAEKVLDARKAIEMLLKGATHSSVFNMLEKKKKQRKLRSMLREGEKVSDQ